MRRRMVIAHVAVLGAAAALSLSACGGTEPLPADQAVAHYDDAATALTVALGAGGITWEHGEASRKADERDGTCEYTPGNWSPSAPLPAPEDDAAWEARIDAANPALEEHGFDAVNGTTADGSRKVLETEDAHGATLQLTAEGDLRIWGAEVTADPCELEELSE